MAIIQCPRCGSSISDKAPKCPKCGLEICATPVNESETTEPQDMSNKFNWGAAGLYPFWGFANGMWWLIFISAAIGWMPLEFNIPLGILASIYMGVKGNELARKYKKWRNDAHFNSVQESWKVVGIVFFILNMVSYFVMQLVSAFTPDYYYY